MVQASTARQALVQGTRLAATTPNQCVLSQNPSKAMHLNTRCGMTKCGRTFTRKAVPQRTILFLIPFLLEFLLTFAQGQGPPIDEQIQFMIEEGRPMGSFVGRIPTREGLTYKFSDPPEEFHLDPNTGEITTKVVIDRESLADDTIDLFVQSMPTARHLVEVRITVLDINDNSPRFEPSSIQVSFDETDTAGAQVLLDTATDRDSGEYGITNQYKIVSGNDEGKFRLVILTDTSVPLMYLENKEILDREERDFYQLNISAQDGGSPPRLGYLQVNVTIRDFNDKPPLFDQSDYSAEINETAPVGTSIIQVRATDEDLGSNAEITYSIVSDDNNQFSIDPRTGVVSSLKKLSCYKQCDPSNAACRSKSCVITVEARDNGRPVPLTGRAFITVILVDVNDHDPTISFRYTSDTPYATVEEGAEEGKFVVALVTVSDPDEGLNGKTTISIIKGNELGHFQLDSSVVQGLHLLRVAAKLDREKVSRYNLTMEAQDMGSPSRKSQAYLIIVVNDINDHAPVFQQPFYSRNLSEILPVGSFVASITATDNDTGVNAAVSYSIVSGNDLGWFTIGTDTGLVTTMQKLDRERRSKFVLSIKAQDGVASAHQVYTTLNITIWDENDQAPQFTAPYTEVSFPEGTRAGIAMTTFTAMDEDEGKNGTVRYYLDSESEHEYPDMFQLNPDSGVLRNLRELDREEFSEYLIRVRAVDGGDIPLTSTAVLQITVSDINDNAPVFYPNKYYASVLEHIPNNTRVVQVTATDADAGLNAQIVYTLSQASTYFWLDSGSGWIQTIQVPPVGSYSLTVIARDKMGLQAQQSAQVTISVVTPQHTPPVFSKSQGYSFSIREDNSLGAPVLNRNVGQITATSGQGQISYTVTDGDKAGMFIIGRNDGVIKTAQAIDREHVAFYTLTVVASSGSTFAESYVNISVTDLNDNVPMFSVSDVQVRVIENWPVGHEVYLASAYDPDDSDNGKVTYTFIDDSFQVFKVDASTGMISVGQPLRELTQNTFVVNVQAKDAGRPSLSSRQRVSIFIDDVNDHTPTFEQKSYEVSISESQTVNDRFFNVTAVDNDYDLNGHVTYEITNGNKEGKFGIFPDGVLYIAQSLDRETRDLYVLTIKASDSGEQPRYSFTNITIYILDANDNDPRFSSSNFAFSIRENQPAGTSVGTIYASDVDLGQNSELNFYIDGDENGFSLNPRTGLLVTSESFDREQVVEELGTNVVRLTVVVQDGGRKQSQATVEITIEDENDNAPEFTKSLYQETLYESTSPGGEILRVNAFDKDIDQNSKLLYSIVGNEGIFVIDPYFGQITLNKSVDRETRDMYTLTIMAMDEGEPPLNGTATVVITVLDNNDNRPEFVMYEDVSVSEDLEVGSEILQVSAVDADLGSNGVVEYDLMGTNMFHIDQNTGRITLTAPLDYETQSVYFINITASDLGSPPLTSSIISRVTVLDVNDNSPVFQSTSMMANVREDARSGTSVTAVQATDKDSGDKGEVMYSIKKQEPPGRTFTIDVTTGVISTAQVLDHEVADSYQVTVVATDQAHPVSSRKTTENVITVNIIDQNDNAPEFVSVSAVPVPVGTATGSLVTTVKAVDKDSGDNGQVRYEIYSGDTYFRIDSATGEIFLRESLNPQLLTYDLTIRARDSGPGQKYSFFQLTIFTTPNQENGPTFSQTSYSGQVYENEHAGTSIVTVSASYPTNPGASSNIEYRITGITSGGIEQPRYFQIHPTSGLVSTSQELDREAGYELFDVEVYAVDKGASTPRTRKTNVQITLLDKNDSPPRFGSDLYELSVPENSPSGHIVSTVVAMDADSTGSVTYTIKDGAEKKFDIDPMKGEIRVIGDLDRETKSSYSLQIEADDGNQRSETLVVIEVSDVNDQTPTFTQDIYIFGVSENTKSGTRLGQILARDGDEGSNAELTYSIVSHWGRDKFSLHPHTGIFTLIGSLDYEQISHYILTVKVQDSGRQTTLSSTVTVYMNVEDVNDNAPIFDPSTYSDQVWENATVGTSILSVSATDIDSGPNGRVEYSITGGDVDNHFAVDKATGVISVVKQLDRESQAHYNLAIQALDQATDPRLHLSSTAVVTVVVKDTNDNAPEFSTVRQLTVTENAAIGASVFKVIADDLDDMENGQVEYALQDDAGGLFSINRNDGVVQVKQNLDRESQDMYVFSVVARDKGNPSRSSTATFTVAVGDANDNNPEVNPERYSATIRENVAIGTSLLEIHASDLDQGQNAELRYLVASGDDNEDFYLNPHSGELSVQKRLDYERKQTYVISVRVEDQGEPKRFDTAIITITVEDVNDCTPHFTDSPYVAYVQENVFQLPVHVAQLTARDEDSGAYGRVSYSILEGDRELFRINSTTGEISAVRTLDREEMTEYHLTVVAMDTGSPRLTGTGTILIMVGDVNDNTPVFHHAHYDARVMENLQAPANVVAVWATDRDAGNNAQIRYTLVYDGSGRFAINPNSGQVTTKVSLNREEQEEYQLVAMATDNGRIPLSSTVTISVRVGDDNDNAPRFLQSVYNVNIRDPTPSGGFVVGVVAMDADTGVNGAMKYSLLASPGRHKFTIDESTGVITAATELNSTSGGIDLRVRVTDMGSVPLSDEASLKVTFLPSSTSGFPVITTNQRSFRLSEQVSRGHVVTTIAATSPRPTAVVTYYIAGGNLDQTFEMTPQGEVKVKDQLDFERTRRYSLWVEARDNGSPALSSFHGLIIDVVDENDNIPVFDKLYYNTSLPEEEFPPLTVLSVTAVDKDTGDNGRITYAMEGGNQGGVFAVDSSSGRIYTQMKLDRELVDAYKLVITATDHGNPRNTATATVDITVIDKNDKPPLFSQHFNVRIAENLPIGSFVLRITSTDEDIGINAQHRYTFIQNPSNKFAIDPRSGNITVAAALDRETKDEFILEVAANDGAYNSETSISIDILDVNDNVPRFDAEEYEFSLVEGSPVGTSVGKVSAADRDAPGPNSEIYFKLKNPTKYFRIHPTTGVVYARESMQYKFAGKTPSPENTHKLTVIVFDQGEPPLSSEVAMTIQIKAANLHAPVFVGGPYDAIVAENSAIGTTVLQMNASDELDFGENGQLVYGITGGNGTQKFTINAQTGVISLAQLVTGQIDLHYILSVKASDLGTPAKSDSTTVNILVSEMNRNAPSFTGNSLAFQTAIPETRSVGATIGKVTATDRDSGRNGAIDYSIVYGDPDHMFAIDANQGYISVAKPLDFESQSMYYLNVTATDKAAVPKSAWHMFSVNITDENDNPPVFDQEAYEAYVSEDAPQGSFVFQLKATDADFPPHDIIKYDILGDDDGVFALEGSSLVVSKELDYESTKEYEIDIQASNPGTNLKSATKLRVYVEGVNEYVPRFSQKVYSFTVSESARIGYTVGSVRASDEDSGPDGIVIFSLIGDSNMRGFTIDSQTGVIMISDQIDREATSEITLDVLVKNEGPIRGNDTDMCQVRVIVRDANDPPQFTQSIYPGSVREDSPVSTTVLKVSAVDNDLQNDYRSFSYSIQSGNIGEVFTVNSQTGWISTNARLDRELYAVYNLTVAAVDNGSPPQTGTASVKIYLADINDNGPMFIPQTPSGNITENQSPGTTDVIDLTQFTFDLDLPPNQGPYRYSLLNYTQEFTVTKGIVKSKKVLDREAKDEYYVAVKVDDNGAVTMTSNLTFKVMVNDVNDNPSTPRMLDIQVFAYQGRFSGGQIADVRPNDLDTVGDYTCSISSSERLAFTIPRSCELHASQLQDMGSFELDIKGSDGAHATVAYLASVEFERFDDATIDNSIVIKVRSRTAEMFLESAYKTVSSTIQESLQAGSQRLVVYAMETVGADVNIFLAVINGQQSYMPKSQLLTKVTDLKSRIEQQAGISIISVDWNACSASPCQNGGTCSSSIQVLTNQNSITDTAQMIFTSSPKVVQQVRCECQQGYTGVYCQEHVDVCKTHPCLNGGTCTSEGASDFSCHCPPQFTGRTCENDVNECTVNNPCRNGATCLNSVGSYRCQCTADFSGDNCEIGENMCGGVGPCLNGGTCDAQTQKCLCQPGDRGVQCEVRSKSLNALSYLEYTFPMDKYSNTINVEFSTSAANALLLYFHGDRASTDFLAIELIEGQIRFSFAAGDAIPGRVTLPRKLNDGMWHRVEVNRIGAVGVLKVSDCLKGEVTCQSCPDGEESCHRRAESPSQNRLLDNDVTHTLLVGGLRNTDDLVTFLSAAQPTITTHDYRGCIRALEIDGKDVLALQSKTQAGVQDGCQRDGAGTACTEGRCQNGGKCRDEWTQLTCECAPKYIGKYCEQFVESYSLGANTIVTYTQRQTYIRDQLARSELQRRRKRATTESDIRDIRVEFRTRNSNGLLFYSAEGNTITSLLVGDKHVMYYVSKNEAEYIMTAGNIVVNDGNWHNVTLHISDTSEVATLTVDDSIQERSLPSGWPSLVSLATKTFFIAGSQTPVTVNNTNIPGFEGCLKKLEIGGGELPLDGSTERFNIHHQGNMSNSCDAGFHAPIAKATNDSPPVHVAVIVIVVLFGVILIVVLIVFVLLRLRRKKQEKEAHAKQNGSAQGVDKNNDSRSHQDSGFTENGEVSEEAIIRQHIEDELNSRMYNERAVPSSRPDLVVADGRVVPVREPQVVLEPNGFENAGYNEEPPEHYDIDNASSIAPSDLVDVVSHYKQYRRGMLGHHDNKPNRTHGSHHHHRHGITPSPNNMLGGRSRESPLTVSRQSPAPYSSQQRNSPNPLLLQRQSPLTVNNLNGPTHSQSRKSPGLNIKGPTPVPASMRSTPLSGIDGLYSPSNVSSSSYERPNLPNGHVPSRPNSHLRQPISTLGIRSTPTMGLTVDEVNRLNARHKSPVSTLDAVSSSSDEAVNNKINTTDFTHADLLDPAAMLPPESSSDSESNDDSFTCSEFEYDNDKMRQDFTNPSRLVPPRLARVSENEDTDTNSLRRQSASDSNRSHGDSFSTFLTSDEDMPGPRGSKMGPSFNWDYLLNWGPNFEKLVGVFTDIAQLPDANMNHQARPSSRMGESNHSRPPSRGSATSPRPQSAISPRPITPKTSVSPKRASPHMLPPKSPTPRSVATPSPLHVIEEDGPYRENGVDSPFDHSFDNVREEYV